MKSEKEKITAIMKENSSHSYLATSDGDQPRVRPVSPVVEDDMTVWITTFSTSRKVKQIQKNPKICLSFVEQPDGDRAVTVIGKAEIIDDSEMKRGVWDLAPFDLFHFFPDGPGSDEYCVLKIAISKIEWRDSWTGGQHIYEPPP
jgi:general stress protein 26